MFGPTRLPHTLTYTHGLEVIGHVPGVTDTLVATHEVLTVSVRTDTAAGATLIDI